MPENQGIVIIVKKLLSKNVSLFKKLLDQFLNHALYFTFNLC